MSEGSVRRALLRIGALTTAAVLVLGGTSAAAFAQDDPTSTSPVPTQTSTPQPPSSEPAPPSSSEPAPPSTSDPAPPSSTPPAPPVTRNPAPAPEPQKIEPPKIDPPKAAVQLPNVKVTASIDKTQYQSHEPVRLTLTITNLSSFPAEKVNATAWGIQVHQNEWGDFASPGATLAPGETRTITVSGSISSVDGDKLNVSGYVLAQAGDADQNDNHYRATATVTRTVGNANGVVFTDVNRNGQPDAGEAVAGAKVSIYGGSPTAEHRTTTDANGRFSFTGVPSGTYNSPYYELPGGWVVHVRKGHEEFTISPNQTTELTGAAERPYAELLTATASLDQESYAYPAQAKISLTLKNIGEHAISGIQAACNRSSEGGGLGDGPGWGDLRYDRAGITLAPGEAKSFAITEDIPASSRDRGTVWLDCDFAPYVGYNADGPRVSDSARVTGGTGSTGMKFQHDKNGNHQPDPGEEVVGLKVSLKDQQTGAVVAEGVTGPDGELELTGVPVGTYWAAITAPWMFSDGVAAHDVAIFGYGSRYFFEVVPGTAAASMRGTVKFEKSRYESDEKVRFWLTVTNVGGQTAERVRLLFPPSALEIDDTQWGDFRWGGTGLTIPAGESRTFDVTGKIREIRDGKVKLSGVIDHAGLPNSPNSTYYGEVDVVQTRGDVSGVVYADRNRNGQQDAGEAAEGAVVELNGGAPYAGYRKTTDANGLFSFKDLPSGDYSISYTLAGGWIVHRAGAAEIRVEPGTPVELTARGERPYHETLSAALTLDQDVYEVGEKAKITIRLTNTGDRALRGIQAACGGAGNENRLGARPNDGKTVNWGELLPPGEGVTVGPGETRTIVAVEKVPEAALDHGDVVAACYFAPNPAWNNDGAFASDSARVPGGYGTVKGQLAYDRNGNHVVDAGEAIGNTRIVLRDRELGVDVAGTYSDDKGNVYFDHVPAGDFRAWIDGPWKFAGENDGNVRVFAGTESRSGFFVVPDPRPGPGGGGTPPAGGGSGTQALAKTGASVLGLGLLGALLVAFGFGASVIGRRRTA